MARPLLIVSEEHPPYEMLNKNGEVVGINIDILKIIFEKLNIDYEVRILPWKRAWHMMKQGTADAALSVSRNEERKKHVTYPLENLWEAKFIFFTLKENKLALPVGYEEAKKHGLRIGIISGNSYHSSFWKAFPFSGSLNDSLNPLLELGQNIELNFLKLSRKRFDLFPIDRISGTYQIKRLSLQEHITSYDKILFSKGYPMPISKKSTYPNLHILLKQFELNLVNLKNNGKHQAIIKKWLTE